MQTYARVLADSVYQNGAQRLTTLEVCFPRFILAEFNTHRMLSRNFRSSRAVPVAKLIAEVRSDPFIPAQFRKNKSGMQAGEELSVEQSDIAEKAWRLAAYDAASHAETLALAGVHKQWANRGLEPYLYVTGVVSGTEWANFFALRRHKDAQPEFQELAEAIWDAMAASPRRKLGTREWHLPYVSDDERALYGDFAKSISAARCAWASFKPFDEGEGSDIDKVVRTLQKLRGEPMHASPFEHQARPFNAKTDSETTLYPLLTNFRGWVQQRALIENGI